MNESRTPNGGDAPLTLPGYYYYDPDVYEREKGAIFRRTWQYVGHVSQFGDGPGYVVREIADESIAVIRSRDGVFRAFYNVCQHRAHRLLEGEGKLAPLITCPYHSWAYDHEGRLQKARGTDQIDAFDKSAICLSTVQVEEFCGFVFINMDPDAESLATSCAELEREIRELSPHPEKLQLSERYDIPLAANWKNSVENFSECYHCPNRHPTLTQEALELETYRIECREHFHVHRSRDKGDQVGYQVDTVNAAQPNEFRSFYIWPNTVLEVYPGGNLTVFHHGPDGPESTLQGIEWYFADANLSREERAVIDFVHTVRMEDVPICESVQRGLHSRGYGRGTLVVDAGRTDVSEHAVHDFQMKVLRALGDDDPGGEVAHFSNRRNSGRAS